MANPQDEFDRQQKPLSVSPAPTGQARSLAASTDPNNASRFARLPPGIGGNPVAVAPAPGVSASPSSQPATAPQPAAATPAVGAQSTQASGASPVSVAQSPKPDVSSGPSILQGVRNVYNESGKEISNLIAQGRYGAAVGQTARAATAYVPAIADDVIGGAIRAVGPAVMDAGKQFLGINDASTQPSQAGAAPQGQASAATTSWDQSKLAGSLGGLDKEMAAQSRVATPADGRLDGADQHPMTNFDRTGMTNAQVAQANPGGRVTMTRQPDGTMSFSGGDVSGPVSYMNSAGNPLVGSGLRGNGFIRVDSAPAGAAVGMDDAGNYAFSSGNPIVSSAGRAAPAAPGQINRATASPAVSGAVDAALGAAAARGDFDAVQSHYAGRGQAFGSQAAAPVAGVPALAAPVVRHSGNDWAARQQLKDLETSASSITNRAEWRSGSSTPAWGSRHNQGINDADGKIARFNAAMQADLVAQGKVPDLQQRTNETNAGLQRAAMSEQGENYRAAGRNAIAAAGLAQRSQEMASQAELRNLEVQRAQRSAGIMQRYDSAKDDAERMQIIRQYPDVFGQKQAAPQGKDRYMTVGGGTSVVDGQTVREPTMVFDTVTQQYVGGAEKSLPPMDASKQAMAIRDNPKLTYDQKVAELEKLGYNR